MQVTVARPSVTVASTSVRKNWMYGTSAISASQERITAARPRIGGAAGCTHTTPSSSAQTLGHRVEVCPLEGCVEVRVHGEHLVEAVRHRPLPSGADPGGDPHGVARPGARRAPARTRRPRRPRASTGRPRRRRARAAAAGSPSLIGQQRAQERLARGADDHREARARAASRDAAARSSCGRRSSRSRSPGRGPAGPAAMPALSAAAARAASSAPTSSIRSSYDAPLLHRHRVATPVHGDVGDPEVRRPCPASPSSARPPETSLTSEAPASTAAPGHLGAHRVDADHGARRAQRADTTGSTRSSSSVTLGRSAPGRVDSPPTSTRSAPAASTARPWSIAAAEARATCRRRRTSPG